MNKLWFEDCGQGRGKSPAWGCRGLGSRLAPPHSAVATLGKPTPPLVLKLLCKEGLDSELSKGLQVDRELGVALAISTG